VKLDAIQRLRTIQHTNINQGLTIQTAKSTEPYLKFTMNYSCITFSVPACWVIVAVPSQDRPLSVKGKCTMRILSSITLIAFLLVPSVASRADGLIYKLPKDGTSVEFEMKGSVERNGETRVFEGTLSISSVGKETADDEACRWIEFKMVYQRDGNERTMRVKVLIPEKQLAAGKNPFSHVKKGWIKMEDREAREITEFSGADSGPLPSFLAGPFSDAKKLEAETIESGLGKLKCKGVSGSVEFKQGSGDHKYTFINRLNDKAPFGVVSSEMKFEMSQNGQIQGTGTITIKVSKVGKNAITEISNTN
jgi:hypothetical protein